MPAQRSVTRGPPQASNDPGFSRFLERGLAILSSFTPGRTALGISELSREISLSRSATRRYAAALARLGYLRHDDLTRTYHLGPRVLDLGFPMPGTPELREIAAPHLRRLTSITGHTSNLAIRDDTDVILIDRIHGRPRRYHHLEFTLHAGSSLPTYCSATGKARDCPGRDRHGRVAGHPVHRPASAAGPEGAGGRPGMTR